MIGNKSLRGNAEVELTLNPAAHTAGGNGATVDLAGAGGCTLQVTRGAWTDGNHTITFQHSDDGSSWTDIDAEDLEGHEPFPTGSTPVNRLESDGTYDITDNSRVGETDLIEYIGGKRYVRGNNAGVGTTTGAIFSVGVIKHNLRYAGRNPQRDNWDHTNEV